ncbi:MAG: phenylalanine--tRNA ligase subunit alpha, partial [Clostridiales bacterium]|nr:phenylalanine--tRNA ligase subunit alpha [Clostridiales bacterium]
MKETLERLRASALAELEKASDLPELESIRIKYSGKKGELTSILKGMGKLSAEERPIVGQLANEVRGAIEEKYAERLDVIEKEALAKRLKSEALDVTMPGVVPTLGYLHPLTSTIDTVRTIFGAMGFETVDGPEI